MDHTACAACGAETLLFECPHCERAYCADHELPHHACDGFSRPQDAGDDGVEAGDPIPDGAVPFRADERDAARETRPDTERRWPVPDVRGLPDERQRSLEEWFHDQSLVGYTLKVGVLSLLFNAAYFAGLAAALYGFV